MADDEEIVVTGTWRDHISGPITKSSQSVEKFKDKAEHATVGVEGLSKAEDSAADNAKQLGRDATIAAKGVDKEGNSAAKAAAKVEALARAEEKAGDNASEMGRDAAKSAVGLATEAAAADRTTKQLNQLSRAESRAGRHAGASVPLWKRLTGAITGAGSGSSGTTRRFGLLGRSMDDGDKKTHKWGRRLLGFMKTLAMLGLKVGVLTSLVTLLGLGIEGLAAAGVAAVYGLAPLTGMIIAYPGMLAAAGQAFATFKLATSGMGDYLKVRMDPNATAQQIADASKGMAKSQVKFIDTVAKQKSAWTNLKKSVGGAFFAGLDKTFTNLASIYIPMLNKHLTKTATIMNGIVKRFGKWMGGKEGTSTIAGIMGNNNQIIGNMGPGILNFIKILALLVHDAGPMLIEMSKDVQGLSGSLLNKTRGNESKLTAFFSHSYDLFKTVARVTGDYLEAFWNIAQASKGLSRWMGSKIDLGGQGLLKWTENKGNIKKVQQWFADMQPVIEELALWVRDLSLSMDQTIRGGDTLRLSRALRQDILPVMTDFIQWMNAQMVPFLTNTAKIIGNLRKAGFLGGVGTVLNAIMKSLLDLSQFLAWLPDQLHKIVGAVSAISTGLYVGSLVTGKSDVGMLNKMSFGLLGKGAGAVQHVWVDNITEMGVAAGEGGAAGGAAAGAAGGAGGAAAKAKWGVVGGIIASAIAVSLTAGGEQDIIDKLFNTKPDPSAINKDLLTMANGGTPTQFQPYSTFMDIGDKWQRNANPISWVSGWDPSGYEAASQNLQNVDAALQGMVKSGNIDTAAKAFDSLAASAAKLDYSKDDVLSYLPKYAAAVEAAQNANEKAWNSPQSLLARYSLAQRLHLDIDKEALRAKIRAAILAAMQATGHGPDFPLPNWWIPDPKPPRAPYSPLDDMPKTPTSKRRTPPVKSPYRPPQGQDWFVKPKTPKNVPNPFASVPSKVVTTFLTPGLPAATNAAHKHDKQVRDVPKSWITKFLTNGADKATSDAKNVRDMVNSIDTSKQIDINLALHGLGRFNSALASLNKWFFAGGETPSGNIVAGELGPEAWVSRSGAIKMLGLHGPEMTAPGIGAVVPASATSDPFGGNPGQAPAWAVQTLQKAVLRGSGGTPDTRDAGLQPLPPINMQVYPQSSFDLELAVKRGIQRAQTEARERG